MSREILFKAKRKDNGEWVEGDAIHEPIGMSIRHEENGMSVRVPVDPDTLCQYTGLNDNTKWEELTEAEKESFLSDWNYKKYRKNKAGDWKGRKIWENDICEMVYSGVVYVYVIVWDKEELDFKGTNGEENYGRNFEYLGCCEEIVVIGNIFDNSELLEVE